MIFAVIAVALVAVGVVALINVYNAKERRPGVDPTPAYEPRVAPTVSPTIIGEGDNQVKIPPGYDTQQCTATQIINDRRCGDMKVLLLPATKLPYITRGIVDAWMQGWPFILHRNMDADLRRDKREQACQRVGVFTSKYGGQCDEYPFASSTEGGPGAHTEEVPGRENSCQGGIIARGLDTAQVADGEQFLVVITYPEYIAQTAFSGTDTAKDQTPCVS